MSWTFRQYIEFAAKMEHFAVILRWDAGEEEEIARVEWGDPYPVAAVALAFERAQEVATRKAHPVSLCLDGHYLDRDKDEHQVGFWAIRTFYPVDQITAQEIREAPYPYFDAAILDSLLDQGELR